MGWFWNKPKPAFANCVCETLSAAYTMGMLERKPVRIIEQDVPGQGKHVQAEAFLDGKWTPLTCMWNAGAQRIEVVRWTRHFDVEPIRIQTFREFVDERKLWVAE